MPEIWDDWVPGVLCRNQMEQLSGDGWLTGVKADALDHSAIDLHLCDEGYLLEGGSVKPYGEKFFEELQKLGVLKTIPLDTQGAWALESRKTYLFRLRERV